MKLKYNLPIIANLPLIYPEWNWEVLNKFQESHFGVNDKNLYIDEQTVKSGKTTTAIQFAAHNILKKNPTIFISKELNKNLFYKRLIKTILRFDMAYWEYNELSELDKAKVDACKELIQKSPFRFYYLPNCDISKVESICDRLRTENPKFNTIIFDCLFNSTEAKFLVDMCSAKEWSLFAVKQISRSMVQNKIDDELPFPSGEHSKYKSIWANALLSDGKILFWWTGDECHSESDFYKDFYYADINQIEYAKNHNLTLVKREFKYQVGDNTKANYIFDTLAKDFYLNYNISPDSKGRPPY